MKSSVIGLMSALMVVCFLTGCPVVPPVQPHGIGFGGGLYLLRAFHDSERTDNIVELAAAAGIHWSREEFHWEWIEPEQGVQDKDTLERYDRSVTALRSHDISILGLLAYDTPWSAGANAPASDAQRDDYARFAASMVKRYRGSVHYWEIWNEPNLDHFWQPQADPLAYAALLRTAYAAVKQADPAAMVVGCATSGVDLDFIRDVLGAGGGACMDVLSIHPYSGHESTDVTNERQDIRKLRALLAEYGLNLPIWVTEVGFQTSSNDNGVSEEEQGGLLARTYLTLFAEGVDVVINYDFVDDGTDPTDGEQNFGMLHHDLSPKPAYTALATTAALLAGAQFEQSANLGAFVEAFEFSLPDAKQIWALWTRKPDGPLGLGLLDVPEVNLPVSGTIARIIDLYGRDLPLPPSGTTRMTPKQDPIFVTVTS
jgi:hypothetical protein